MYICTLRKHNIVGITPIATQGMKYCAGEKSLLQMSDFFSSGARVYLRVRVVCRVSASRNMPKRAKKNEEAPAEGSADNGPGTKMYL